MTHREACYELRQSAARLSSGSITRAEWHRQVSATISKRQVEINAEFNAYAKGQAAAALRTARSASVLQPEPSGAQR